MKQPGQWRTTTQPSVAMSEICILYDGNMPTIYETNAVKQLQLKQQSNEPCQSLRVFHFHAEECYSLGTPCCVWHEEQCYPDAMFYSLYTGHFFVAHLSSQGQT